MRPLMRPWKHCGTAGSPTFRSALFVFGCAVGGRFSDFLFLGLTIPTICCIMSKHAKNRGVAQFGRALRSGRRGRGFESRRLDSFRGNTVSSKFPRSKRQTSVCRERDTAIAGIAQPVEHFTRNEGVVSSNLISSFFVLYFGRNERSEQQGASSRRGSVW